jgi:sialidase-1
MTAKQKREPGRFHIETCGLIVLSLLVLSLSGCRKPLFEETDLFMSGTNGYDTYRIPSFITTKTGTLLAFCEGRKNSQEDSGDIDLVFKRSTDGGKTWSSQTVIWDDGENFCGNPCPVVDLDTGTIWLVMLWKNGSDNEVAIDLGLSKDTCRVFICSSVDDGLTFSKPVEITSSVKSSLWRWYATGPGKGIQLQKGAHKGRLVIPCNHSTAFLAFGAHVIYSDDHGKTWQCSETISGGADESQAVELADGSLMMNMRIQWFGKGYRGISRSDDGGETWTKFVYDTALPDPVCQASIIRYSLAGEKGWNRLLFSNPATGGRNGMTVRLSYDEGDTWPVSRLIYAGPSAYSCLTVMSDKSIGLLYEKGDYGTISLARFNLAWLTDSKDYGDVAYPILTKGHD